MLSPSGITMSKVALKQRPRTRFFAALAHTDNIAHFDQHGNRHRISNTNVLPPSIGESLLLSLAYPSAIHHDTRGYGLDPNAIIEFSDGIGPITHVFADCGAYHYRAKPNPCLSDGNPLDAKVAWDRYVEEHRLDKPIAIEQVLLCAPDHMLIQGLAEDEVADRIRFNESQAREFIQRYPMNLDRDVVIPVGVIHGRTIDERKQRLCELIELGYSYVALGGMVPFSTKPNEALDIVAGLDPTSTNSCIDPDSILGRCNAAGVKLHVFGLSSPEWMKWWIRLGITSFDGTKLTTDGAANGWYWIPFDGRHGRSNHRDRSPRAAGDLFTRENVKNLGLTKQPSQWSSFDGSLMRPIAEPVTVSGISTTCDLPCCTYLGSARCTSTRCWATIEWPDIEHVADPRCMGSTEHNMGRMAHNAHVYEWLKHEMESYNREADTLAREGRLSEESHLNYWTSIA
jgi:hypothetical protein